MGIDKNLANSDSIQFVTLLILLGYEVKYSTKYVKKPKQNTLNTVE